MRIPAGPFWATLPLATLGSFFLFSSLRQTPLPPEPGSASPGPSEKRAAFLDEEVVVRLEEKEPAMAIRSGVEWLIRHQFVDGMWSAASYTQMCPREICEGAGRDRHDGAVTALALWCLLDSGLAGETAVWEAAREALSWLKKNQEEEKTPSMYGRAISTIAFCRAFDVLGDPYAKSFARDSIRWLEGAQNSNGGWGYRPRDGRSDSSVTAWVSRAFLFAESIDIEVSPRAGSGALEWFDSMTGSRYYQVSYRDRGRGGSSLRNRNDHFESNGTLTALATAIRMKRGFDREDPRIREAVRALSWNFPVWNRSRTTVDFTYWHGGTIAMDLAGEELRPAWMNRIRRLLGRYQEVRGCRAGSWNPVDKWGCEGGRIYATALNVLTLSRATQ